MKKKLLIILLSVIGGFFLYDWLDIGFWDWPHFHRINIGQGIMQIVDLDIMFEYIPVMIVLMFIFGMGPDIVREFKKGLHGK